MSSADIAVSHFRDDPVIPSCRIARCQPLHCLDDSILIYLDVPGSSVFAMSVLDSDSIASVKLQIQSCKGFVVKKQKLVFDGRELARNDSLVRDYGVSDGNILHLVIRVSDLLCITVNTSCGMKFEFKVERSRNLLYIKNQIAKHSQSFDDIENQKLICNGEELDDQLLVNNICSKADAAIHLLIGKPAELRSMHTDKDFELPIEDHTSVIKKRDDELKIGAWEPPPRQTWVVPVIVNPKVRLSPTLQELISSTHAGLEKRNRPVMSSEGSGGAYFMLDEFNCKYVAVFKPVDEEPMAENNPRGLLLSLDGEGLKRGTRVGEGALREVAAYILDHPENGRRGFLTDEAGFSGVPPTIIVWCISDGDGFATKDLKVGSLQKFVENSGSCEDIGPASFPVEEVHKIAVLDLRLANADRHAGNILVCRGQEDHQIILVPIDHGYCFPESFEDCTFDWLFWPQARQSFDSRSKGYINSLDAEEDIALLKFYGWEPSLECSRTLRISTMLLKKGAERGLSPYDIGSILCRETIKKESKIEEIIREAKDAILPGTTESIFIQTISDVMDRYLDKIGR